MSWRWVLGLSTLAVRRENADEETALGRDLPTQKICQLANQPLRGK